MSERTEKFTEGRWYIEGDLTICGANGLSSDQRDICYVNSDTGDTDYFACPETARANANLIASAPELYEFAKEITEKLHEYKNGDSYWWADEFIKKGRAITKKARGEQ